MNNCCVGCADGLRQHTPPALRAASPFLKGRRWNAARFGLSLFNPSPKGTPSFFVFHFSFLISRASPGTDFKQTQGGICGMTQSEIVRRLESGLLPEWENLPDFGLYLDQMLSFADKQFGALDGAGSLTGSMINNYVKAGLIERPSGKKYSRAALAQLLILGLLKPTTPLDVLKGLLRPEDGDMRRLYTELRAQQSALCAALAQREADSPIHIALEAASLQRVLRLLTAGEDRPAAR